MSRTAFVVVVSVLSVVSLCHTQADPPEFSHHDVVSFSNEVTDAGNLSGIALIHELVAICADETARFDLLARDGQRLKVIESPSLGADETEIDMEGLAAVDDFLYIVGSHSLARKGIDAAKSYNKNRKRILTVNDDEHRDQVFRLIIDKDGGIESKKRISLRKLLKNDPLLGPFATIPSKENGIDIEGIAVRDKILYLGFRGPVLRDNYVPVMTLEFGDPEDYDILFVDLRGDGIRDITAAKDGFLILAGANGDVRTGYFLYLWNGKDCLVGENSPGGKCQLLGEIKPVDDGKAEGVAIERETDASYELLIVFDGVNKGVYRFTVPK